MFRLLIFFSLALPFACHAGVVVTQNVSPGATSWPGSPLINTVTNPANQTAVSESFNSTGGCTNYAETFTIAADCTLQTISIYAGGGTGTVTLARFRTNTLYDGLIDFDVVARATTLTNLNPAYDSGDHLHLNPAGYHAMANSIDLTLFTH